MPNIEFGDMMTYNACRKCKKGIRLNVSNLFHCSTCQHIDEKCNFGFFYNVVFKDYFAGAIKITCVGKAASDLLIAPG